MTDEELKKILLAVPAPKAEEERKENTIRLVMAAKKELRGLTGISWWKRIRTMAGYISPAIWLGQGAVLLLVIWGMLESGINSPAIECLAGPLLGGIACLEVQKSYACGMWELEQSCRYDARQVMLLKMQITGGADLLILLGLLGLGISLEVSFTETVLCLLVPYFLSVSVYLLILCRTDRRASNYVMAGAGILLAIVFLMSIGGLSDMRGFFLEWPGEWAAVLLVFSVDLMLLALRHFWKTCNMEEKKA